MNVELMNDLKEILSDKRKERASLKKEVKALTESHEKLTRSDLKRLNEIKEEVKELSDFIDTLNSDIRKEEKLEVKENSLREVLYNANTKEEKDEVFKELVNVTEEVSNFKSKLEEKYDLELQELYVKREALIEEEKNRKLVEQEDNDATLEESDNNSEQETENEENKKSSSKDHRALAGFLAGVALTGAVVGVATLSKGCEAKPKQSNDIVNEETEEDKKESLEFTNINDEEELSKRASKIAINANNAGFEISEETIIDMMKWYNGGVPSEVSEDYLVYCHRMFIGLVEANVDPSGLMLDGTDAQKALKAIYENRIETRVNLGTDKVNESGDKLAEITAGVLYGLGNKATSNERYRYAGQRLAVITAIADGYAYGDTDRDCVYVDENGQVYVLSKMVQSLNGGCTDEYGNEVDYFSSLIFETLDNAVNAKEEAARLTLNK